MGKTSNSRPVVRADDKRIKANRPPSQKSLLPKTRWQKLLDGEITVEDLDMEELIQGKVKNKNGQFSSRPPKRVPAELFKTFKAEFHKRAQERFESYTEAAMDALASVATNTRQPGVARVQAANALLERSLGKVTDKVQQEVIVKKWEENFGDLLVDVPEPEDDLAVKRAQRGA